jgi:hypothetical protein
MSRPTMVCPECRYSCPMPASQPAVPLCPICGTRISVATPRPPSPKPAAPPVSKGDPGGSAGVAIGVAALLLIALGAAYFVWHSMNPPAVPVAEAEPAQPAEPRGSHLEPIEVPDPSPPDPPKPPPAPPKPKPLTEDQKKVNAAIDRGITYLKGQLEEANGGKDKVTQYGHSTAEMQSGYVALMALTLLECDVPATDAQIQKAAETIRKSMNDDVSTYDLSVAIMFLERLGDPRDRRLIELFALRLVAGQTEGGNWDYGCKPLSDADHIALRGYLSTANYGIGAAGATAKNKAAADGLPDSLKGLAVVRWCSGDNLPIGHGGNNSTTQFGLLGLWVAQRSGVPVFPAMAMCAAHFRASQKNVGTWTYSFDDPNTPYTMTCAGLLGLAVGRSLDVQLTARDKKAGRVKDPAVNKGMKFVANSIAASRLGAQMGTTPGGQGMYLGRFYYFWCLERVAVIYGLDKIGGQDWYDMASKQLVEAQKEGGQWEDIFPGAVDTCFALLVLKRANVAKDLTKTIETYLDIKDLGSRDSKP